MYYSTFTQWILEHGVPEKTLELFLAITIVATIVSIFRYLFGTKSYGIYAPILLAIAYSYTGLKYGLAITFMVITVSLLSHLVLKKIRMHYITRIAINYCLLSVALITFMVVINRVGFGLENMSTVPPLALISIVALSDFFTKQFVQKSSKSSFTALFGTVLIATAGWFVITRDYISNYVINN
ncbi:MAG TPA: 7TM domain-containing protein, partial [Candidatus Dojkabacteria bacterium]|nr:7TM domain-containing protein [Candidatus Dojkabacteria bacterium]